MEFKLNKAIITIRFNYNIRAYTPKLGNLSCRMCLVKRCNQTPKLVRAWQEFINTIYSHFIHLLRIAFSLRRRWRSNLIQYFVLTYH